MLVWSELGRKPPLRGRWRMHNLNLLIKFVRGVERILHISLGQIPRVNEKTDQRRGGD
jgi:hypothetical protein